MSRQVESNDLFLFAINTSELYSGMVCLAENKASGFDWLFYTKNCVWPQYKRELGKNEPRGGYIISCKSLKETAFELYEYYTRHIKES